MVGATPQAKIDLARLTVRPFDHHACVFNRFSCGRLGIDRWLKNKAEKATARLEHRVFTAHLDGNPKVIGYYALQIGSDSVAELQGADRTYLRSYTAFPAVHLAYLGVHSEHQRQGVGKYLLMDAFTRAASIAEHAGFYAFTLVSLDDESTAFYKSIGFSEYVRNASQPKMLMPLQNILDLMQGP